jgi:hypothetical protein
MKTAESSLDHSFNKAARDSNAHPMPTAKSLLLRPHSARVWISGALTLLTVALLTRTILGNPPFDSDPSCRAPNTLLEVEEARAAVRQRGSVARTVGLSSGPGKSSLIAETSGTNSEVLLRMCGEVGANYQLLTATNINGPWDPARSFLLNQPEAQWIDAATDQAATRFYRLSVPKALEMESLTSNFRLLDLMGRSYELYYYTQRRGVAIIAAGERLEHLADLVPELNALHAAKDAHGTEVWVVLSDALSPREKLRESADRLGFRVPVLLDRDLMASSMLGIGRTTEAVLVRAPDFVTVYRGAVRGDEHFYLREAILALQSGRQAGVWQTSLRTPRLASLDGAKLSYSQDIAPILRTSW